MLQSVVFYVDRESVITTISVAAILYIVYQPHYFELQCPVDWGCWQQLLASLFGSFAVTLFMFWVYMMNVFLLCRRVAAPREDSTAWHAADGTAKNIVEHKAAGTSYYRTLWLSVLQQTGCRDRCVGAHVSVCPWISIWYPIQPIGSPCDSFPALWHLQWTHWLTAQITKWNYSEAQLFSSAEPSERAK